LSLHVFDQASEIGGTISICSPDHIGLLIHKTFNASIPRHHIPIDQWEFEYGSLENDPEYGAAAEEENEQPQEEGEERGRWVHKVTGETIGGGTKRLEFTIVG
jgi:DNA-directed RNA polymerase I subunit RPA43